MTNVLPVPSPLAEGRGRIYFYRLGNLWGAMLYPKVRLDGEVVGKTIAGRYFFKDVDPGTHEITIKTEVARKLTLPVAAGETRYVKVSVGMGWLIGRFRLEAIAFETAREEVRNLMLLEDDASLAGR